MDELAGHWCTDNSGGIHVLYGSCIHFDERGRGWLHSWGGSDEEADSNDPKYEYEVPFEWIRIDDSNIRIKRQIDSEWTFLNYKKSIVIGEYGVEYQKIISTGNHGIGDTIKEWFWDIPEALYRRK